MMCEMPEIRLRTEQCRMMKKGEPSGVISYGEGRLATRLVKYKRLKSQKNSQSSIIHFEPKMSIIKGDADENENIPKISSLFSLFRNSSAALFAVRGSDRSNFSQ